MNFLIRIFSSQDKEIKRAKISRRLKLMHQYDRIESSLALLSVYLKGAKR